MLIAEKFKVYKEKRESERDNILKEYNEKLQLLFKNKAYYSLHVNDIFLAKIALFIYYYV